MKSIGSNNMLNLDALNEAQRKAVMHGEGPLLVLAGPGSGKTFTITQRILYLIEVMQVAPEEILVITFTKEAALSMQRRFQEQSNRIYPVNFGTFHSVFYQILRNINSSHTMQILRENQKKNLIFPIMNKMNQANKENACVDDFLSAISFYKNTGNMEQAVLKLQEEYRTQFPTIFKAYEEARKKQRAIDFDDMVYECANILEKNQQAREYWSKRFSHILMDEFQDINPMQYRVIRLLTPKACNLFAVGDDDQAIYGFRGSHPACMQEFVEDYKAEKILLNINYRCYPSIVNASLRVIEENKERFSKALEPCEEKRKEEAGNAVKLSIFMEKEEQNDYLARALENSKKEGTCAVLFRTNMQMQSFAAGLKRRGIPYEMKEKSVSIYEHFIVKDIMAYLRIAAGEDARGLYLQILNKPARMLSRESLNSPNGKVSIETIKAYYNRMDCGDSYVKKAKSTIALLEKQISHLGKISPFLGVQYICKVIGYEHFLELEKRKFKGKEERSDEWVRILEWLKEEAKSYNNLYEWIKAQEEYAEESKGNILPGEKKASEDSEGASGIQLMTVHASKGLEFDYVYIPDCNEKIFPYGTPSDKESCEEERRIFYVAMTRAKKSLELLSLTGTKERPRLPSRFVNPLLDYSSTTSSNSQLSRYSSKASATFSYSSSSSIKLNSGSSLGSSEFSLYP